MLQPGGGATPTPYLVCPLILATLAEFDREMIVEGTLEGLASARAPRTSPARRWGAPRGRRTSRWPSHGWPAQLPRAPLPWNLPDGYDDNPPLPEDAGWEASARLERSLVAYIGLQAPDPAAVRTVDAGTVTILTDGFADEDWIHNGIWEAASSRDEQELGVSEHRDYQAIGDAWVAECRYSAAGHGITWYRQAQTVTVPASMTDDEAIEIWQRILDRFPAWISGVIGEARKGRSYVSGDDMRSYMAPGARWVVPRSED